MRSSQETVSALMKPRSKSEWMTMTASVLAGAATLPHVEAVRHFGEGVDRNVEKLPFLRHPGLEFDGGAGLSAKPDLGGI